MRRRKSLLAVVALALAIPSLVLIACGNQPDGQTPTCGQPYYYYDDAGTLVHRDDGDPNCYTPPGSAATLVTSAGGAPGSGGSGGAGG